MNYNQIKLSIYESYSNNEITFEATKSLIDIIDNAYVDSIVSEMADAEHEFISTSLSIVTESADITALTEAANTFSEKAKALWNKVKAWFKTIIDKILGRKKQGEGTEVIAHPKLKSAMGDMSKAVSKLRSARTVAEVSSALAAIAGATVAVKKYNKLKVQNEDLAEHLQGSKDDYAKICDENKKLIQDLQDATDKASKYLQDVQTLNKESEAKDESIRALEKTINELNNSILEETKKSRGLMGEVNSAYAMVDKSDQKIESLKRELAETKKKLDDAKAAAKKREADLTSERDAANAKIKQMTPSYFMGIATQAARAIERTTAIALPQKSTETIDNEEKEKKLTDAKKKQEAEDMERYKQAAMNKYEAEKSEKQAKMNEEAKKKIPAIKAELKRAMDRLDGFNIRKGRMGKSILLSFTSDWPGQIDRALKSGDYYVAYLCYQGYLEQINKEIKEAEEEAERVEHPERFGRRRRMW